MDRQRKIALLVAADLALVGSCFILSNERYSLNPTVKAEVFKGNFAQPESYVSPLRAVYPKSLIPGGIRNADEFRERVSRDKTLARWFSTFDFSSARPCRLPAGRYFVTVRQGDRISWSQRPVEKGDQDCLTDGITTVLTKCGNQVSFNPQEPTTEISTESLSTPEFYTTFESNPNVPGTVLPGPSTHQPEGTSPSDGRSGLGIIPVPPITIIPVPLPTVKVSEPSLTSWLWAIALGMLGALRLRQRKTA